MSIDITEMTDEEFAEYRKKILPELQKEAARAFAMYEQLLEQEDIVEPIGLANGPTGQNGKMHIADVDEADDADDINIEGSLEKPKRGPLAPR